MGAKNKDQSRQSLSSMKESPVKGLKNVLANPQEFTWTILKNEKKKKELDRILEELLPKKEPEPRPVSWAKLRKMSKEERLALKKNSPARTGKNKDDVLYSVIFGINATTKALEKDLVGSILLDSTVDPLFMVRHVVIMAQKKDIPVILIPSLKTITLGKLGFAAAAMALKKNIAESEEEYFHKLHKKIADLNAEFPQSKDSNQPLNKKCEKNKLQAFEIDSDSSSSSSSSETEESVANFNKTNAQPYILPPDIYKYRTSRKERVFVPPTTTSEQQKQFVTDVSTIKPVETEQSAEFISLNMDIDMIKFNETAEKVVKKRRYMDNLKTEKDEKKMKEGEEEEGSSEEEVGKKQRKENLMDHDVDKVAVQSGSAAENLVPKSGHSSSSSPSSGKLKMAKKTPGIYLPLKVKQVQKNPNRVRATKAPKIKKKNAKKQVV